MVKIIFLFLMGLEVRALPLEQIFQANDANSLKQSVKKDKERAFLNLLCAKQKEKRKPPTACYALSLKPDLFCLRLTLKDLKEPEVEKALESRFLSLPCRLHLKRQRRVLIYRQKDFLIPELKKHWTESKKNPLKKRGCPIFPV